METAGTENGRDLMKQHLPREMQSIALFLVFALAQRPRLGH
jgi:hypothetical protein